MPKATWSTEQIGNQRLCTLGKDQLKMPNSHGLEGCGHCPSPMLAVPCTASHRFQLDPTQGRRAGHGPCSDSRLLGK